MERVPVEDGAVMLRAVVGGAAQTVVVAGAVVGVAALLQRTGPAVCLAWLVAFAAAGWTGAAALTARSGDAQPGAVRDAGWWATTGLAGTTLAVTSPELYAWMLAVVLVLVAVGLRLTVLSERRRAPVAPEVVPPGPRRVRTAEGA